MKDSRLLALILSGILTAGLWSAPVPAEETDMAAETDGIFFEESLPALPEENDFREESPGGLEMEGRPAAADESVPAAGEGDMPADAGEGLQEETEDLPEAAEEIYTEESESSISFTEEEIVPAEEEQPEAFENGYILVKKEAPVYSSIQPEVADGCFPEDTIVFAECISAEGCGENEWLCVLFETADERQSADVVSARYVRMADTVRLSEEEAASFRESLAADPDAAVCGDNPVPEVFNYVYCVRKYGEEEISAEGVKKEKDDAADPLGQGSTEGEGKKELLQEGVDAKIAVLKFTQQPSDQRIYIGESTSFSVKVSGKGVKYQWQWQAKGGSPWTSTSLAGAKTRTLQISNAPAGFDGRHYRCLVTNPDGDMWVSREVLLEVVGADIISQPSDTEVEEGRNTSFQVTASGPGLSYQWQWQAPGSTVWQNTSLAGARTPELILQNVPFGFCWRSYRCIITDAVGRKTETVPARLTVTSRIEILSQPESRDVLPGSTAVFQVTAFGTRLAYQWQWQAPGSSIWADTYISGSRSSRLTITNASTGFNGRKYRCIVTNIDGKQTVSTGAALTISGVRIDRQPSNARIDRGNTAVFKAEAEGIGLTWQWQWQDKNSSSWSNTSLAGARTAKLIVTGAPAAFNGRKYRCIIRDRLGKQAVTSAAVLTVVNTSTIRSHVHSWVPVTSTYTHPAETKTVHHDAVYKTVHHDVSYQTIHHDAVTHEEYEYIWESHCWVCGALNPSIEHIFECDSSWYDTPVVVSTTVVVDTPAWDEKVTVPAWDEQVLVSSAWNETVTVRPAWSETVTKEYRCSCGETKKPNETLIFTKIDI